MSLPSHETARSWPGLTVLDRDGDTVGTITHIYLDRHSRQPSWALVVMPERGRVFVPLSGAGAHDDRVKVLVAKAAVREAPEVRARRDLTEHDVTRLHRHYGVAESTADHGAERAATGRAKEAASRASELAGGATKRLRETGSRARGVATSVPAKRLLSAAGAASALGAVVAVAARTRLRRRGPLRALAGLREVPAAALRRRRRRQRVRAAGQLLGDVVTAPVRAAPRPLSRERRSKIAGNFKLAAGLATGYVMGTRAGRERYERLVELARRFGGRSQPGGGFQARTGR